MFHAEWAGLPYVCRAHPEAKPHLLHITVPGHLAFPQFFNKPPSAIMHTAKASTNLPAFLMQSQRRLPALANKEGL